MGLRHQYTITLYRYRTLFDNRYIYRAYSKLCGDQQDRTDYDEFFVRINNTEKC